MSKPSFKQFHAALSAFEAGQDLEAVEEGLRDWIKGKTELSAPELEKLHAASVKGDVKARQALDAYARAKSKEKNVDSRIKKTLDAHSAHKQSLEKGFQGARAEVEAGERGSSRAYDKETGTVHRGTKAVRWDHKERKWVSDWSHVGKHD